MLKRLIRVAVTVVFAGIVSEYGGSIVYLAIAPILSAVGKYIRIKYPDYSWIPF